MCVWNLKRSMDFCEPMKYEYRVSVNKYNKIYRPVGQLHFSCKISKHIIISSLELGTLEFHFSLLFLITMSKSPQYVITCAVSRPLNNWSPDRLAAQGVPSRAHSWMSTAEAAWIMHDYLLTSSPKISSHSRCHSVFIGQAFKCAMFWCWKLPFIDRYNQKRFGMQKLYISMFAITHFCLGTSSRISDWTCHLRPPLCQILFYMGDLGFATGWLINK